MCNGYWIDWFVWSILTLIVVAIPVVIWADLHDDSPPHWADVCTHETTTFIMAGKSLIPMTQCFQYEKKCVWGHAYKGMQVCPPKQG